MMRTANSIVCLLVVVILFVGSPTSVQAQDDSFGYPLPELEVITHANASRIEQLARLGLGPVLALAWSPDGNTLALASSSDVFLLDVLHPGAQTRWLTGHTDWVRGVTFSPDGSVLASAGSDDTLRLWSTATGEALAALEVGAEGVAGLDYSPDGRTLALAGADNTVRLWSILADDEGVIVGQQAVLTGHGEPVSSVAFSPDGETLVSGACVERDEQRECVQGEVLLWSAATGEQTDRWETEGNVNDLVFGSDGERLLIGGGTYGAGVISVRDITSGDEMAAPCDTLYGRYLEASEVRGLTLGPNETTLVVGSPYEGGVKLRDLETCSFIMLRTTLRTDFWQASALAFSPDGRMLASGGYQGVVVWDMETREPLISLKVYETAESVACSSDGKTLAVGHRFAIRLWEMTTGERLGELPGKASVPNLTVAYSPDGKLLASGSQDVELWSISYDAGLVMGEKVASLEGHWREVISIAFSPDGNLLATGTGRDGELKLWALDPVTGIETTDESLALLGGHTGGITGLSFSPDGTLLATSAKAYEAFGLRGVGDVKIWPIVVDGEVVTGRRPYGEELYELRWIADVNDVAFHPDGQTLFAGNGDGAIWRWNNVSPFATLAGFGRHPGGITSLMFNADGTILLTGSADNWWINGDDTIRLWAAESTDSTVMGELLTELNAYADRVTSIALSADETILVSGHADGTVRLWGVPVEE
jgi:WD40 repeat protein